VSTRAALDAWCARRRGSLSFVLDGQTYTIGPHPARDWMLALFSGSPEDLLLDLLTKEDADDLWEAAIDEDDPLTVEMLARIGQSMLTKAAGRPWWQASMLLATLAVNWDVYIAVARDRGLGDPSDWPVDELCAWVYLRMTQYAKEEDRARIDADLTTPPGILTPTRTPSTPRTAAGRSSARRWPVSAWGVPEQVWSDPPGYLGHALLVADRVPSLPNERPGR